MRITRRHFLEVSTGAAALFSTHAATMGQFKIASECRRECVLLDLQSQCCLDESFLGYVKILGGDCVASAGTFSNSFSHPTTIIIPAAGVIDTTSARMLGEILRAGSVVLFESGGGFLNPGEFSLHQQILKRHLNVLVEPPVNLWASEINRGSFSRAGLQSQDKTVGNVAAPYVDYTWPHKTKVRDFSQVVPLAAQDGEVIGMMGKLPIALRKQVGKGTLIFLGSTIGPHLRAGDPEARRWLHSVLES
jgi:hypothetical protein